MLLDEEEPKSKPDYISVHHILKKLKTKENILLLPYLKKISKMEELEFF